MKSYDIVLLLFVVFLALVVMLLALDKRNEEASLRKDIEAVSNLVIKVTQPVKPVPESAVQEGLERDNKKIELLYDAKGRVFFRVVTKPKKKGWFR